METVITELPQRRVWSGQSLKMYVNGVFIKLDNVFEVIYRNSHKIYSEDLGEGQELCFQIIMSRNLTPEQRADILMNGTVRMYE